MFRKLNIKTLSVIFVLLLALVVLIFIIDSKKGGRTFPDNLVKVDTAEITGIEISQGNIDNKIELVKDGNDWKLNLDGKMVGADKSKMNNILDLLTKIKPTGLVTEDKGRWEEYQLTDSLATRVKLFVKNKKKADLMIGKFDYKQGNNYGNYGNQRPAGIFKTFVRNYKEKEVYTVKEFLRFSFSSDVNSYRDPTVVKLNPEDLTKISFFYPSDSSFVMTGENGNWMVDGLQADSLSVANYIRSFSNLTNAAFTGEEPNGEPMYKAILEGNNIVEPVVVSAYSINDSTFLVRSSMNKDATFRVDNDGLFNRIYASSKKFLN